MSDIIKIEYNFLHKNEEYIFYITFNDNTLEIIMENSNDTQFWKCNFDSKYLEDLTSKAGSFKSFPIFIKMVQSAMANDTDTVKLDILTSNDLEQMRNRSNQSQNSNLNTSTISNKEISKLNKKYLIISYFSDFESVKYPLPLTFIQEPDFNIMRLTIERLKKNQNISSHNNNSKPKDMMEEMRQENRNLMNKIQFLESKRQFGAVDNDEVQKNMFNSNPDFETYYEETEKKKRMLTELIDELKNKLNSLNVQNQNIDSAQNKITQQKNLKTQAKLKDEIEQLSSILSHERNRFQSTINQTNQHSEKLQSNLIYLKENELKMKIRIQQLEKEIDNVNKKSKEVGRKMATSTPKSVKSNYSMNSKKSYTSSKLSNASKNSQISKNSSNTKNLINCLKPKISIASNYNKSGNKISGKPIFANNYSKNNYLNYNQNKNNSNGSLSKGNQKSTYTTLNDRFNKVNRVSSLNKK